MYLCILSLLVANIYLVTAQRQNQDLATALIISWDSLESYTSTVTEAPPITTQWTIPEGCDNPRSTLSLSWPVTYDLFATGTDRVVLTMTRSYFYHHCRVTSTQCCPPGWQPNRFYEGTAPPGYYILGASSVNPSSLWQPFRVSGTRTEIAQMACPM